MPEGLLHFLTTGLVCTCLTLFPAPLFCVYWPPEGKLPAQVLHLLVLEEMFQKQGALPTQNPSRGEAGKAAEAKPTGSAV